MSQRVLCVGATPAVQRTMRFERLTRGGVNRAKSVSVTPAGKGVNVAVSLRLLGVEPVLTGFLGGPTGELMKTMLAERGVTVDCAAAAAPTRVCTTILEGHPPKAATELVEEAATPDDEDWRALFAKYRALLAGADLVVLAGALPPHAPVDIYAMFARAAREAGKPLVIDSQKQPLLSALAHRPLVAKLNAHELGLTFTRELRTRFDRIAAATELQRRGAQWVLVTDGARPALIVGADGAWSATAPQIETVNAVGSGDACTAGLIAAHLAGESVMVLRSGKKNYALLRFAS